MINPKTGLEDPNYKPKQETTDIRGKVDTSMPAGAQSLGASDVQSNGGPKLNLDAINQYREKLGNGPQLEHTTTPQGPESTVSNVSGGLSNLKAVATPSTPTGLTQKNATPDMSKPGAGQSGNVWSPENNAWVIGGTNGTTPTQNTGLGATDTYGNNIGQLTPEQQTVYSNMTPAEKQQMKADTDAGLATSANYVMNFNKNKTYLNTQNDINKQIIDENGKIKEIQSSERIKAAETQLNNLKQNVAYLGTGGKPGVSSVKMDAISKQLSDANSTFQNLKAVEASQAELTKLGIKFDANAFGKKMTDLQDDLDNKVSKQIQNAINEMNAADVGGKLDTIEEINAFRTKLFTGLDNQISGVAEVNFTQRASILKEYADMENKATEAIAKGKKIDPDLSSFNKFYTDGNGSPMISKTTGLLVPYPEKPPYPAVFSDDKSTMITFSTGPNGELVSERHELIKETALSDSLVSSLATLVSNNPTLYNDVIKSNPSLAKNEKFISAIKGGTADAPKTATDSEGNTVQWNGTAWVPLTTGGSGGNSGSSVPPESVASFTTTRNGSTKVQCGELTNDWWKQKTGSSAGMGDTYSSKINAIAEIGETNSPVVGGLFVSNPLNNDVGHTGIVQSVNSDGSITVREANAKGLTSGQEPISKTYSADQIKNMSFSVAPQATTGQTKEYNETQKNLMFQMDSKNLSKQDLQILKQNGLKADDVYNYKTDLKKDKWSAGLDDTEYKRVNSVIDDLAQNQVTKTFQKSQEAYLSAIQFAKGENATDNQAMIYAFAKAMDPDSVVREGEYATVQKYAQTWGEKLGMDINRIMNGEEFISPKAKNNIVNTIKSKYEASKATYENLRNNKITMVNDIAGKDIGNKAIPTDAMEMGSLQMYEDGTFKEYDNKGNYRYYGTDKKLSDWKPVGQSSQPTTGRWQQSQTNSGVGTTAPTQGRWQSNKQ